MLAEFKPAPPACAIDDVPPPVVMFELRPPERRLGGVAGLELRHKVCLGEVGAINGQEPVARTYKRAQASSQGRGLKEEEAEETGPRVKIASSIFTLTDRLGVERKLYNALCRPRKSALPPKAKFR